jgi:hypothetical protein
MTTLIDKDELMEWVNNWLKMDHYYHQDEKRNDIPISELEDIIKRVPTVDAIPIAWIENFIDDIGDLEEEMTMRAVYSLLINEWRKEE